MTTGMDDKDRSDQPLPGSVSNQNAEEAEPGHGGDEEARKQGADRGHRGSGGEAGEGSQSTGHPDSAG
jgi:hypothetical protein